MNIPSTKQIKKRNAYLASKRKNKLLDAKNEAEIKQINRDIRTKNLEELFKPLLLII